MRLQYSKTKDITFIATFFCKSLPILILQVLSEMRCKMYSIHWKLIFLKYSLNWKSFNQEFYIYLYGKWIFFIWPLRKHQQLIPYVLIWIIYVRGMWMHGEGVIFFKHIFVGEIHQIEKQTIVMSTGKTGLCSRMIFKKLAKIHSNNKNFLQFSRL